MPVIKVDHPLLEHKLGLMRHPETSTKEFRELAREMGALLTYEATRDLPLEPQTITGWDGKPVTVNRLRGKKITVVPILRAGIGLLDGVQQLLPGARISVVGIRRNEETLQPWTYVERLAGSMSERFALVVDPMLATGGSLVATLDALKAAGCPRIKALVLVAAPEGIAAVMAKHPEVEVYTAAIDSHLNEVGYIIPGLGDAGDRIFGTRP